MQIIVIIIGILIVLSNFSQTVVRIVQSIFKYIIWLVPGHTILTGIFDKKEQLILTRIGVISMSVLLILSGILAYIN